MTSGTATTMGIPRLQELQYLTTTAKAVAGGLTFEQTRRALISHMQNRDDIPGGNSAGYRLAADDPGRYVTNAATALKELMWLGYLEREPVPSRASAAAAYAAKRFTLTDAGRAWVAQVEHDPRGSFDELLRRLWAVHPQLAGYLQILGRGELVVPTQSWSALHPERVGAEGRPVYVQTLSAKAARAAASGRAGWSASEHEIAQAIDAYVTRLEESAAKRQRTAFPNHRSFVQACEEALVSFAFGRAGVPLDYISVEILRRWTQELLVANFSYYVPAGAATALRLWATADIGTADDTLQSIGRRPPSEWASRVLAVLPEAFERARALEGDRSFVMVHRVRAAVCHELAVNDVVFDTAIRDLYAHSDQPDAPLRLKFEVHHGVIPPTARPLRLKDRTGEREYQLMSLMTHRSK